MSTVAASPPAASRNSEWRRDQTRRKPTTRVVPVSAAPTGIPPSTATFAARTSQVSACSRYQPRSKPSASEWIQARSWA